MKLVDKIEGKEYYIKRFAEWEASEQIIDDKRAFWCLKEPGSKYQKVCLYRDGCNMFVYGDYGQFSFDSMTWLGSVYNLKYDNIGYQTEKLNYDSRQSLYAFDDAVCKKDIEEWLAGVLENENIDDSESKARKAIKLMEGLFYTSESEIDEFCEENDLDDLENLICFVRDCLENADEHEWIAFLRRTDFSDFDEPYESSLWNAGKRINQRYFICMYALQVCGEKLKAAKQDN